MTTVLAASPWGHRLRGGPAMPLPGRRGGRSKAGEVRTTARGHSRAGAAAARSDPHRHPTRPVTGGTVRAWGRVREGGRGCCSVARPSARGVVEPALGAGSHSDDTEHVRLGLCHLRLPAPVPRLLPAGTSFPCPGCRSCHQLLPSASAVCSAATRSSLSQMRH